MLRTLAHEMQLNRLALQSHRARLDPNELAEFCFADAAGRRVAAPDLVQFLDDVDRRWRPEVILFESNAAFAGIRDLLLRHASFGPKIKSVTQTREKYSRVVAFSVPVENGALRLKGRAGQVDAGQQELWDELVTFPAGEHDDLLDAAAMGTAYLLDRPEPRSCGRRP